MSNDKEFLDQSQLPDSLPAGLEFIYRLVTNSVKAKIEQNAVVAGFRKTLNEMAGEQEGVSIADQIADLVRVEVRMRTESDVSRLNEIAAALAKPEIVQFLQAATNSAVVEPASELSKQAALTAYRKSVAWEFMYADYRGIQGTAREEHVASFPLDDLYVMPNLRPERATAESWERERIALEKLDDPDLEQDQRDEFLQHYEKARKERWRSNETDGQSSDLALSEVLRDAGRHLVVLGDPGVGKSVMLKHLSRSYALGVEAVKARFGVDREQAVPVLISLARFADARSRQPGLTLRGYLDSQLKPRGDAPLIDAISEELKDGRVLVLLDGVDELPPNCRSAVIGEVEDFLRDNSGNRIIISSRPFGYVRLQGNLPHYYLRNFSPGQVRLFIENWQRAFEQKQHPQSPNLAAADQEAATMISEIEHNPKVAELSANPLMLVVVSLIRLQGGRLPEKRVELYSRAVNSLMDTWNQWRTRGAADVGGTTLPLNRLISVWASIAEWTRRTKPTGVMHRAELQAEIVRVLREKEYDDDDPDDTADSYLNAAVNRAGLLEERGLNVFAFWHPTFEEYLAAVELGSPAHKAVDRLLPLRGAARWREVIQLAVGYLGVVKHEPDAATEVVREILERGLNPVEPVVHANLRLAAACVADDVGVKRSLAERVIRELAEVCNSQPYDPFVTVFTSTLGALRRLRPSEETIAALAPLESHARWQVRAATAQFCGNAVGVPAAVELCKGLVGDSDQDVSALAALG